MDGKSEEEEEKEKEKIIQVTFLNKEKEKERKRKGNKQQPIYLIEEEEEEEEVDDELFSRLDKLEKETGEKEKERLKLIPKYSEENIKNIIYPINFPIRKYQYNILKTTLFYNTLVCLPTGYGKTLIGFIVSCIYFLLSFHTVI